MQALCGVMSLLHPWMFAAALAAMGLPVLVHWLTRPRPRPFPLSTVRFVFEAVQQRRARHRLRDAIVLLLRTVAVLLLGAALARPLLAGRNSARAADASHVTRVVLLDA